MLALLPLFTSWAAFNNRWAALQSGRETPSGLRWPQAAAPGFQMAGLCAPEMAAAAGAEPAWLERNLCRSGIGYMPNATQGLLDQWWLQALELAREGGPLALSDWAAQPQGARLFGLAWSNTSGHILVDLAMPTFPEYGRRHADLLLDHQALLLALRAAAKPPVERATWLRAQPIDERLRARIRLEGSYTAIEAKLWSTRRPDSPTRRYPIPPSHDT